MIEFWLCLFSYTAAIVVSSGILYFYLINRTILKSISLLSGSGHTAGPNSGFVNQGSSIISSIVMRLSGFVVSIFLINFEQLSLTFLSFGYFPDLIRLYNFCKSGA